MKPIAIASDHAGFRLKEKLKSHLAKKGLIINDLGTYSEERCDYPDFAGRLASSVSKGRFERGVLVCKSGIGNSIVANKFPGVRAALCYNARAAKLSREHNDSNVLVLGSAFVNQAQAERILNIWVKTGFLGGRHRRRLNLIKKIEKEIG